MTGNEAGEFVIDQAADQLKAVSMLTHDTYRLQIVAENVQASCHRGRVDIHVIVVDEDLAFENTFPASVPENAVMGYNVTIVTASGGSGIIEYSIMGGNEGGVFGIDRTMGNITVTNISSLDIQVTSEYRLTIRAVTIPGGSIAEVTQVIHVEDINEAPRFETSCARRGHCTSSVLENLSNRVIMTILASDPDATAPNNVLTYSILGDASGIFGIDNSGNLAFSGALDHEIQATYSFSVVVMDGLGLNVTTRVTVNVLDANDNAPVFIHAPQQLTVAENTMGSVIEEYIAEDADIDENADISYSVSAVATLPVTIDSESGMLSLSTPLDYENESQRSFQLTITASNPDGLATSIAVSLIVTDVNDNIPQFSQLLYSASVIEHSTTGTVVTTVVAIDKDQMGNDPITYSITDGNTNDAFTVHQSNGTITVNRDIDREIVNMYTLEIEARDSSPANHNTTTLLITVSDINDNAPRFELDTYTFYIPEDYSVSHEIGTLTAFDIDETGSPNSRVIYSIVNDTDIFQISENNGSINLISSLDFETQSLHNITAVATDQGNPQNTDSATVYVHVININEDPPTLSGDETVYIFENEAQGYQVAQVTAVDQDQMAVTFSLSVPLVSIGLFSIDPSSGIVTLQQALDFETQTQHILNVTASDGQLTSVAVITVNVRDVNEFAPAITFTSPLAVDEERQAGTYIGSISASDSDSQDNITFSLQSSRISLLFTINSESGEIRTAVVLDRESLVQNNLFVPHSSQQTLNVIATDDGQIPGVHTTVASIVVTLVDVNDNFPLFTDDSYSVSVLEDDDAVASIITVTAVDLDLGSNGLVSYYLTDEDSLPFSINSMTGEITGQLDRESMDMFTLQVTARDNGNPVRSTNTTIDITVLDVNDNPPVFQASFYNGSAPETVLFTQEPCKLLQVAALDADIDDNGRIAYSIAGQGGCTDPSFSAPECLFSINATSGEFFLTRPVDFETQSVYTVTVVARDGGVPHLSDSVPVTINIINVDEAPPQFIGPCDVSVPEDYAVELIVTTCSAIDLDQVMNDAITYTIQDGNVGNTFSVNSNGQIILVEHLDHENRDAFEIIVRAEDANEHFTDMKVWLLYDLPIFLLYLHFRLSSL